MSKDYYWLNSHSRQFLERGYLKEGVTPEQRIREIAENAEKILDTAPPAYKEISLRNFEGFADKFEEYMKRGFFSLATPVWTNFGNERGLPVSCFNSHISDTMNSILTKAAEIGMMSKYGGGTSAYFGDLRARGSSISVGGESSGPVHFMEIYETVANVTNQGSARRGSFAAYLPIDHPDIEEFLQIRSEGHPIQNMSIGVTISDEFMIGLEAGDKDKRRIWAKIIQKRFETGYPYILFSDNVNNSAPQVYKDNNIKIKSSNLCCVVGSEMVLTSNGYITAEELYQNEEKLTLFDGVKTVKSSEMKLISKNEDVFKITLENGMTHTVTKCHKLPIYDTGKVVECRNLRIGDKISIQKNKGLFGSLDMQDEAFLLGLYQADGTQHKDTIHICIWENDFDLEEEIKERFDRVYKKLDGDKYISFEKSKDKKPYLPNFYENDTGFSTVRKRTLSSPFLKRALNFEKGYIPDWIWRSNEETQWQYIRGLFYADGTVNICENSKGSPFYLSLANINKEFLQELQILLANLGTSFSLFLMREAGEHLLPDGKGGNKYYKTKDCWRLVCGNKNNGAIFEQHTGFLSRKGISIDRDYRDNSKKCSRIKSIEYIGKQPVYCVEVDSPEHLWIVNGIVTHNSEITLQSDENNSFVCVLSSLNLLHWDEIKETDAIQTLTYFLDAVNEEFIRKTEGLPYMQTARNFAKTQRALGLGVLGWHSYLQSKNLSFESFEAKLLNAEIWKTIRERTDLATEKMARAYGEPELLKGYGRRNVTTIAVAPTTSSSFILGQVSPSIEPLNSNYFVKKLAKGNFTYKNPYLKNVLKKYDKNDDDTWKSILLKGGSVQHLDFLSKEEKEVFKTFGEISQKEIVIQAAQRQRFIDQSQSLNLMIPPKTPPKEVSQLLIDGWKMGIKTFYYQRSANPAQELARSILTCSSCEA